jgi:Fe2+ transport system protein FeoA
MTLNKLSAKNAKAIVTSFQGSTEMVERLTEMGLHLNQSIEFLGQAPLGGPKLFKLSTIVLALRANEAECVQVELV